MSKSKKEEEQTTPEVETKTEETDLQAELSALQDRLLRTAAEFDNFRKRTAVEKQALYQNGVCEAVKTFLPVLDNLERAVAAAGEEDTGICLIAKQFVDAMGSLGVREIPALGEPFDPNLHDAVMHVEDDSLGENVVAEVLTKGYGKEDRVIRHCVVKVAN